MIEKAIIFMVAVSLPLMLVVEQIASWRGGLTRGDEPPGHEDRPTRGDFVTSRQEADPKSPWADRRVRLAASSAIAVGEL